MEKVSVIFVNYNSGRFLAESVLNLKSLSDDLEIIVIDNGSSDKSADYLRADSNVNLICVGDNVGFWARGKHWGPNSDRGVPAFSQS